MLGEDHVSVFDEVISRLAGEIEFRARVELAERLADIDNAPRRTVRDLAFDDDIAIARPLLERSTRLEENDLVESPRAARPGPPARHVGPARTSPRPSPTCS